MKKSLLVAFIALFATQAHASLQELIDGIKQDNKELVLSLLKNGENVNAVNADGNSPLHYAVALNNAQMTNILLQYGADMNISNAKGWTPLKIAETKKVEAVAAVLQQAQQRRLAAQQAAAQQAEAAKQAAQQAAAQQAEAAKQAAAAPQAVAKAVAPAENVVAAPAPTSASAPAPTPAEEVVVSEEKIAALYNVLEQAKAAVVEAKRVQQVTEEQNKVLTDAVMQLKKENEILTKRVAEYEDAQKAEIEGEKAAEKKDEKAIEKKADATVDKKAEEAKKQAEEKAAAAKKQAERKAELEKKAPKPVAKKPVYKPRPSALDKNIYAGDEEIVYCLSYFGNGENTNMRQAGAYFAASAGINEARYQQIVKLSDAFFNASDTAVLQKRSDECAKVITPKDKNKQNQIIRSLNSSMQ